MTWASVMKLDFPSGVKALAVCSALFAAAMPAIAQAPELAMLDGLERGAWELRVRATGETSQICLRTGREFIQLRHHQAGCSRFVVEDAPGQVVVQYTCRGDGYGRTTIRRESGSLVQIRSQGIQGGTPFTIDAEARRKGAC